MLRMNLHRTITYAVLSFSILCILPNASAATKGGTNSDSIIVLARLPLPSGPVRQMFFQESGGRHYLYIRQAEQPGYMVVDITDDRRPRIVTKHNFSRETLEMVGGGLGITGRSETTPNQPLPAIEEAPSNPPSQFVRLLDLSDASHPRTLKTFDGVTSIVLDDLRNTIYLTNGEGLWILHHRIDLMRQTCEDESKYSEVPLMCTGY